MKSIAFKLWIGMMALVAVILVLLWFFQIVFLDSFYTGIRINEVIKSGKNILNEINETQVVKDKLDELAYKHNLDVELLNSDLNTVYSTGESSVMGQMPMMRNADRILAQKKVLQGEEVQVPMRHPSFNSEYVLIGLPVIVSGEVQGALMLTLPLAPVEDTANILKQQLVYISILLLAATLLLSYFLSKTFTKPILEIHKVSRAMASGDLTARIKTSGRKDEIGRLADTVNYMGGELSKIDRLRKDLVANVSHELRTPLSLIKGYAETIRDVSGGDAVKREKHTGIIIEEADRLTGIVEDILNLSQMQSGYIPLNIGVFDVTQTLERVVKKFEILSERTGIHICGPGPGKVFVEGDEAKIEQVLYNLINNAFSHSFSGGSINAAVQDTKEKIRIQIRDEGEGITKEELPYIWERFHKSDRSGTRKTSGTGLGLAIVKNILEAHKSQYGVYSEQGKGAMFWFDLKKREK